MRVEDLPLQHERGRSRPNSAWQITNQRSRLSVLCQFCDVDAFFLDCDTCSSTAGFFFPDQLRATAANFTLEQVMASPFPSNLVAAGHRPRVAWVFDAKGVRNIWVADAPDFAARQITHYDGDDGLPIASLRITGDGRTLVYVRGSEANESGRIADPTNGIWARKQQVWAIDVEAGAPRLARRDGLRRRGV